MMKEARLHNIEKHALQQMVLGKWDNTMLEKKKKKKEIKSFFNSNKNKLKMD